MWEREQNSWCFLHIYKLSNHKIDGHCGIQTAQSSVSEYLKGVTFEKRDNDPGNRIYRL